MDQKKIHTLFKRFAKHNPNPVTELQYQTDFELLIAVILSAQATDVSVNKATKILFPIANTAQALLDLGEAGLKRYIQSIGLYNTKAKNIIKTCTILVEKYQGNIPNTRESLESLPGVGRKTANVILNTAFSHPTIAVDTHIFRVAKRIGLAQGTTPYAIEKTLLQTIPPAFLKEAHHWLVLHGRYICVARKPKCAQCFIQDLCEYPEKNLSCLPQK